MKEPRRYIVTDAGEKQYITGTEDIQYEYYCHVCGEAVDTEKCIQLALMGGYTDRRIGFPSGMGSVQLHEECTPAGLRAMMVPLPLA